MRLSNFDIGRASKSLPSAFHSTAPPPSARGRPTLRAKGIGLSGRSWTRKSGSTRFWLVDPSNPRLNRRILEIFPPARPASSYWCRARAEKNFPGAEIPGTSSPGGAEMALNAVAVDGIAALMAVLSQPSGRDWATQLVADQSLPPPARRTGGNARTAREFKIRWWWRPPKSATVSKLNQID